MFDRQSYEPDRPQGMNYEYPQYQEHEHHFESKTVQVTLLADTTLYDVY